MHMAMAGGMKDPHLGYDVQYAEHITIDYGPRDNMKSKRNDPADVERQQKRNIIALRAMSAASMAVIASSLAISYSDAGKNKIAAKHNAAMACELGIYSNGLFAMRLGNAPFGMLTEARFGPTKGLVQVVMNYSGMGEVVIYENGNPIGNIPVKAAAKNITIVLSDEQVFYMRVSGKPLDAQLRASDAKKSLTQLLREKSAGASYVWPYGKKSYTRAECERALQMNPNSDAQLSHNFAVFSESVASITRPGVHAIPKQRIAR